MKTENPEINPHIYGRFSIRVPRHLNGEGTLFSINGVGTNGYLYAKRMKLDTKEGLLEEMLDLSLKERKLPDPSRRKITSKVMRQHGLSV